MNLCYCFLIKKLPLKAYQPAPSIPFPPCVILSSTSGLHYYNTSSRFPSPHWWMILVWSNAFLSARIPQNIGRYRLTVQHQNKESKSARSSRQHEPIRVCSSFSSSLLLEAPKSMVVGQGISFPPLFSTLNVEFGLSHQHWTFRHHINHIRIQKNTFVYLHNSETNCYSYFIKLSSTNLISLPW